MRTNRHQTTGNGYRLVFKVTEIVFDILGVLLHYKPLTKRINTVFFIAG